LKKFFAIVKKDSMLLLRDWPGLAILFVMPAILLIVITFIQENAVPIKNSGIGIIIVNADSSVLGETILKDLTNSGYFNFTKLNNAGEAESELLKNKYQLAIIVPDSSTEKLFNLVKTSSGINPVSSEISSEEQAGILFLYSPALQPVFKNAIIAPVKLVIQLSAVKILMEQYTNNVNVRLKQNEEILKQLADENYFAGTPDFPYKKEVIKKFRNELINRTAGEGIETKLPVNPSLGSDIVRIDEQVARNSNKSFRPGALQNNIPAFTLFAMFFIVIPLAGSIINEKKYGTYNRLRTFPVSYLEIISAKIVVFLIVCILQFILMLLIGIYIMPRLGELPPVNLKVSYMALLVAVIASSLAAIGFGIVVGTFASNHGQAATFGSVMVVILAMLGGIFVPSFMLPDFLRKISMISPLRWGTDAFLGIFAGDGGIMRILPQLCLLAGFFIISLLLSVKTFKRS
jgi:ABC-2 type transport system permease protein